MYFFYWVPLLMTEQFRGKKVFPGPFINSFFHPLSGKTRRREKPRISLLNFWDCPEKLFRHCQHHGITISVCKCLRHFEDCLFVLSILRVKVKKKPRTLCSTPTIFKQQKLYNAGSLSLLLLDDEEALGKKFSIYLSSYFILIYNLTSKVIFYLFIRLI